jgi:hypothetical protein
MVVQCICWLNVTDWIASVPLHYILRRWIPEYCTCTANYNYNQTYELHRALNVWAVKKWDRHYLCRLCLWKRCMWALLLDSLSWCPLSSPHRSGGCLWWQRTSFGLGSARRRRKLLGPFLLWRRFRQPMDEHWWTNVNHVKLESYAISYA